MFDFRRGGGAEMSMSGKMSEQALRQPAPEEQRAVLMGERFVDGLRTLEEPGRRMVFRRLSSLFCTTCGSDDPACQCGRAADG